jgi:hypothetical protein
MPAGRMQEFTSSSNMSHYIMLASGLINTPAKQSYLTVDGSIGVKRNDLTKIPTIPRMKMLRDFKL